MQDRMADLRGAQRKVIGCVVRPARRAHGDVGMPVAGGRTLPFVMTREWSAPAGHYIEAWFLIDPETREVLHEGPRREVHIWGLQSLTALVDTVSDPLPLQPGTYAVVFALDGAVGGEFDVVAFDASTVAA